MVLKLNHGIILVFFCKFLSTDFLQLLANGLKPRLFFKFRTVKCLLLTVTPRPIIYTAACLCGLRTRLFQTTKFIGTPGIAPEALSTTGTRKVARVPDARRTSS